VTSQGPTEIVPETGGGSIGCTASGHLEGITPEKLATNAWLKDPVCHEWRPGLQPEAADQLRAEGVEDIEEE